MLENHLKYQPILLTVCMVAASFKGNSQNRTAWFGTNYIPSTTMQTIPTAGLRTDQKWDVTAGGVGAFLTTDYAFFENTTVSDVLRNRENIVVVDQVQRDLNNPNEEYLHFTDPHNSMNNQISATALGPAVSIQLKNFSLGAFTNSKVHFNANRLDRDFSFPASNRWPNYNEVLIDPTKVNLLCWHEIGLNGSYRLPVHQRYKVLLGVNIKRLLGADAVQVRTNGSLQQVDNNLNLFNSFVAIDHALNYQENQYNHKILGKGWGVDLGFTYIQETNDNRPFGFRLDVALNQIGVLNYSAHAESHLFQSDNVQVDETAFANANSTREYIQAASDVYYANGGNSLQKKRFKAFTPACVFVNADWSLRENWFINASTTRRIQFSENQTEAIQTISLTPRYESSGFSAGIPFLLVNDRNARMGVYMRIGFLTIGSDHVLSWLVKQKNLSGTDIYASVNWMSIDRFRKRKPGDIRCFQF